MIQNFLLRHKFLMILYEVCTCFPFHTLWKGFFFLNANLDLNLNESSNPVISLNRLCP